MQRGASHTCREADAAPPEVAEGGWEGILASDCVYNVAMVPVFSRALLRAMVRWERLAGISCGHIAPTLPCLLTGRSRFFCDQVAAPGAVLLLSHKSRNPEVDEALLSGGRPPKLPAFRPLRSLPANLVLTCVPAAVPTAFLQRSGSAGWS